MSQLYVNEPSAQIKLMDGRIVVVYKDGMEKSIPLESLEGISVFGPVNISSQCIRECLFRGISLQYYSTNGSYFGRLSSTSHVNVSRQRKQAFLGKDDLFQITISKRIVKAKIHNQIVLLRRYMRNSNISVQAEIVAMQHSEKKIENCKSIDEIMGYEGNAAREYYKGLGKLVIPEFRFQGRSKRPPLDPFNSMLSLGYTILMYEVYGAIESRGLNPYFGFMHRDREKHPALASDLMEEWRSVIVDSIVMGMVNGKEIFTENFYSSAEEPGIFLDKKGFRSFITKLERRFLVDQKYLPYADYLVSFRRAIFLQIGELAKAIDTGNPDLYTPVIIR